MDEIRVKEHMYKVWIAFPCKVETLLTKLAGVNSPLFISSNGEGIYFELQDGVENGVFANVGSGVIREFYGSMEKINSNLNGEKFLDEFTDIAGEPQSTMFTREGVSGERFVRDYHHVINYLKDQGLDFVVMGRLERHNLQFTTGISDGKDRIIPKNSNHQNYSYIIGYHANGNTVINESLQCPHKNMFG